MVFEEFYAQPRGPVANGFICKTVISARKYFYFFGIGKVFINLICMPDRNQFVFLTMQDKTTLYPAQHIKKVMIV